MKNTMVKAHEAWLATSMAAFMSAQTENKQILFDFSNILFRHFNWLENALIEADIAYSYDRDVIPVKVDKLSDMLANIVQRFDEIVSLLDVKEENALDYRISTDLAYMKEVLQNMEDETVTAFSLERTFPGVELTEEATDALTLFLFEETYKEYELILIYNYLKAHSSDAYLNRIFQILIDESLFHFKRFGDMGAHMGILGVPRVVMKELYQVEDVVKFLYDGIDEELAAKEECRKLSEAVAKDSPELEKFFNFINRQENYHIALMKDALKHFEKIANV